MAILLPAVRHRDDPLRWSCHCQKRNVSAAFGFFGRRGLGRRAAGDHWGFEGTLAAATDRYSTCARRVGGVPVGPDSSATAVVVEVYQSNTPSMYPAESLQGALWLCFFQTTVL